MGAYEGLSNYLDKSLCDYALSFGYDASNILILEGNSNALRNNHLNIYQNLLSCSHHSYRVWSRPYRILDIWGFFHSRNANWRIWYSTFWCWQNKGNSSKSQNLNYKWLPNSNQQRLRNNNGISKRLYRLLVSQP